MNHSYILQHRWIPSTYHGTQEGRPKIYTELFHLYKVGKRGTTKLHTVFEMRTVVTLRTREEEVTGMGLRFPDAGIYFLDLNSVTTVFTQW